MAVLLPGTASTAEFVRRAFGPPLAAFGIGLVSADPPRDGDVSAQTDALAEAVERFRPTLVGGVSIGAHVVARWAAASVAGATGRRPDGLLLAMPAWTGPPATVAAASATTADELDRDGVPATLDRIRTSAADLPEAAWVVEELAAAWPAYHPAELAATLRSTAHSPGPALEELAAIGVPCGIAVLRDDALHPADVGREWAATVRCGALVETGLAAVGADRATLGRAALLAWLRARRAPRH